MKPLPRTLLVVAMIFCGIAHVGLGGYAVACGTIASEVGHHIDPRENRDDPVQGAVPAMAAAGGMMATGLGTTLKWAGSAVLFLGFLQFLAGWGIARRAWAPVLGACVLTVCFDLYLAITMDPVWAVGVLLGALAIGAALRDRTEQAAAATE